MSKQWVSRDTTDIEAGLIGGLMVHGGSWYAVADILTEDMFTSPVYGGIYKVISGIVESGIVPDLALVAARAKSTKVNITISDLADLTDQAALPGSIVEYARILSEGYAAKKLWELSIKMSGKVSGEFPEVSEALSEAEIQVGVLRDMLADKREHKLSVLVEEYRRDLKAGRTSEAIKSGLTIDNVIDGFYPSDLVVVGASPGEGKTALIVQAALNIAKRGIPVGIISIEMSGKQLLRRMAAMEAEVNVSAMKNGEISEEQQIAVNKAMDYLSGLPMYIDDTAMVTVAGIRARVKRMCMSKGVKIIFLDYIQKIRGDKWKTKTDIVGESAAMLKVIAKENDIPVVALSQVNRDKKRTMVGRYVISDLKNSSEIEQTCDVIMFIYRPEMHGEHETEMGESTRGLVYVDIRKFRDGQPGTVEMQFKGEYTKFYGEDEEPGESIHEGIPF